MNHGGEAVVRFTYDPTISFISQKLPQVGGVIGLITYFKEEIDNGSTEEEREKVESPSESEEK